MIQNSFKISQKIAITGSICSGKSYIAYFIGRILKTPVFSSDAAVKLAYCDPLVIALLTKYFGNEVFCRKKEDNFFVNFVKKCFKKLITSRKKKTIKSLSTLYKIKTLDRAFAESSSVNQSPHLLLKKQIFLLKNRLSSNYYFAYKSAPKINEICDSISINKQYIMQNIINNTQKRKILEGILYKSLAKIRKTWMCSKSKYSNLLFEVPLLFEKNLAKHYNYSICVTSSDAVRAKLLRKRNLTKEYFLQMQRCQMSVNFKKKLSNKIIYNSVIKK